MDLFGLGIGMTCVMLVCAPVISAWSSYLKRRTPSKRVRYIGNGFCVAFVLLILCGVFGKKVLDDNLISAADAGDTATVELILRMGIDVNTTVENWDYTPLMCAASNGHTDTVKAILRHHPDLKYTSSRGTVVQVAIDNNHPDIVHLLEAAGAK